MKNIEKLNFLIKANIELDKITKKNINKVSYEEAERDALTLDYTREEIKNILSNKNSVGKITVFQFGNYNIKINFDINKQFINFVNAEINRKLKLKKELTQEQYNKYFFDVYNKIFKYIKL